MLPTNTKNYGTDIFHFRRQSLLKTTKPLDCTLATTVSGFSVAGTEPVGSRRKIIFEVDGKLYKFDGGNNLVAYDGLGEIADVLEGGNTVSEILAVTNIPAWIGKKIFPIIALDAPADSPAFPKIKLSLKCQSYNDIFQQVEYSPIINLTTKNFAQIENIELNQTVTGFASLAVTAQIFDGENWGAFVPLNEIKNIPAKAIRFKCTYATTALGGADSAKVDSIKINYSTGSGEICDEKFLIYTAPQNYYADLDGCFCVIKTSALEDVEINCFANFTEPENWEPTSISTQWLDGEKFCTRFEYFGMTDNKSNAVKFEVKSLSGHVDGEFLGIATGKPQIFKLEHHAKKESLSCVGDWTFDEDAQLLKVVATAGLSIYATYDFAGKFPEVYEVAAGWIAPEE